MLLQVHLVATELSRIDSLSISISFMRSSRLANIEITIDAPEEACHHLLLGRLAANHCRLQVLPGLR